jgi:hypothetical protein
MAIMRVLMEELLWKAVMGHNLVLECLFSGVRGHRRPIMPGIKWCYFLRTWLHGHLLGTGKPPCVATGGPGMCRAGA